MSTYKDYLQSMGHSQQTVKAYSFYLMDFLAWTDAQGIVPESFTSADVMAYLHHLQKKELSNTSRKNYLIAVRHFFDWHIQRGTIEANPAKLIKLRGTGGRKLYQLLSREELESIYHKYDAEKAPTGKPHSFRTQELKNRRNKAMLGLVVYQGLLTTEVNELTLSDLKLKEGTVFIKGGRKSNERTLELKPQQILELMEYTLTTRKELQSYVPKESPLLFLPAPASGKKVASANDGINIWKRLTAEVREKNPRFKNFLQVRTSVITHWLKAYNLRQVQYMAGHRYVSTTEGYFINQMEDLQNDIDQFHPLG